MGMSARAITAMKERLQRAHEDMRHARIIHGDWKSEEGAIASVDSLATFDANKLRDDAYRAEIKSAMAVLQSKGELGNPEMNRLYTNANRDGGVTAGLIEIGKKIEALEAPPVPEADHQGAVSNVMKYLKLHLPHTR
jgi:hypothetical protein